MVIESLVFRDLSEGLPGLADWLHRCGRTGVRYGFRQTADGEEGPDAEP
jgi:hypothetical protein